MCEVFDNILYCLINGRICVGKDVREEQNAIFNKNEIKEDLVIPTFVGSRKINYIGEWAFRSCVNIKRVNIEARIDTIKYCAFEYCTSLVSINIPSSVKIIENDAIRGTRKDNAYGTPGILNVTFDKGSKIKSIGSQSLRGKQDINIFFCDHKEIKKVMCTDNLFLELDNPHIYSQYSFCGIKPEGKPFGCYNREAKCSCRPRQNTRIVICNFIFTIVFILSL